MKFVPYTAKEKAAPPAVALEGTSEARVGTGLPRGLMVKFRLFEVPPPGAGLNTVTWAVPPVEISLAGMEAVNCALLE